jgi:hypothetical protein
VYFHFGSIPNAFSTTVSTEETQLYKYLYALVELIGVWGKVASARNCKMHFRDKERDLFTLNDFKFLRQINCDAIRSFFSSYFVLQAAIMIIQPEHQKKN